MEFAVNKIVEVEYNGTPSFGWHIVPFEEEGISIIEYSDSKVISKVDIACPDAALLLAEHIKGVVEHNKADYKRLV